MRVLVTGAYGQLGNDVVERCKTLEFDVIGIGRNDADITQKNQIQSLIRDINPDAVIHCAAYTNVDKAEEEKDICYSINVDGTRYIAETCKELNIKFLYISTDYVFDGSGDKPWGVHDNADPINYYGKTKYQGECIVKEVLDKCFIVRTSWVFGKTGSNFVKTMLRMASDISIKKLNKEIKVVDDQIGSPTYTYDLAILLCDMIQTDKFGIYHATNQGYCSWYNFACEIFKISNIDVLVTPIRTVEFKTRAIRPLNSRLNKDELEKNGFKQLRNWECAIKEFISEMEI